VVAASRLGSIDASLHNRLIVVDDPLGATQKAATEYRRELGIPIVGLTGSSGKTTTRSMVSAVLRSALTVGETQGNLNNHIGVPITLLGFNGSEQVGVIEMGANHEHEIRTLTGIARPDVACITNIGYAHIGFFKSLAGTLAAKWEIVEGLRGDDSIVLLNGDDGRLVSRAKSCSHRVVLFGTSKRCQVRADGVRLLPSNHVAFSVDGHGFELSLAGRHFVYCALPAIFLGRHFGISDSAIATALAAFTPLSMRGAVEQKNGMSFILDCYNANPSSMQAALQLLADVAGTRRSVAIVGDMLELGRHATRLHQDLGRRLAARNVGAVVAVGAQASRVAEGATRAGMAAASIHTAASSTDAVAIVKDILKPGDTVLLKGSRGIHLESVYEAL